MVVAAMAMEVEAAAARVEATRTTAIGEDRSPP
jgi:hypothetical protein